jgi:glycosyltransferase involved in cell wall biosynthesis
MRDIPYRIIHFGLGPVFDGKFLAHPYLNSAQDAVFYFSTGQAGYKHDKRALFMLVRQYLKAIRLLACSIGVKNRSTIAYCHTTKFALPSLLICRLFGVGHVIYFNHGVPYIAYSGWRRQLLYAIEMLNVWVAKKVFTVSPGMVPYLIPNGLANRYDVSVKPGSSSGLPDRFFLERDRLKYKTEQSLSSPSVNYLYAGRLQERKGVFLLLEAWQKHTVNHPSDRLFLCGFSKEDLLEVVPDKVLSSVEVCGYLPEIRELLDQSDVVVSPSFHEGFGYTLLEGAARGCCIVSSNVPGPDVMFSPWMKHYLFQSGSVDGLGNLLDALSADRRLLSKGMLLAYRSSLRFSESNLVYPRPY